MNKKGFTLIELLAVIVILAIIALIAVPIILKVIEDAKKSAAVDSAYGYIEAIEFNNSMASVNKDYQTITETDVIEINKIVKVKGTKPISGEVIISNDGRVKEASICISGYQVNYQNNKAIAEKTCDNKISNTPVGSGNIIVSDELQEFLENTQHTLTIYDILTSEYAMTNILQKKENVDYIINNYHDYATYIINNKSVFNIFLNNSYALDKMLSNSKWTNSILNSETAIEIMDSSNPIKVPTMTSNTSPSGEVIFSSFYTGYPAYKAFDKNLTGTSYWGVGAGLSYKDQYVGYGFENEVWVYKIDIKFSPGKQDTDFVVEASNDKNSESWDIIKSGLHESATNQTIIMNNYNKKYKYYRIRMLSDVAQSGSGNTIIYELQFYGK